MRKAVYPGSFDPITNGHLDVLKRSLAVFDEVTLLLAVNPSKTSTFSVEERLRMMRESIKGIKGASVDFYPGLVVDYCHKNGATHIIRGLRAVTDFENEFQLAASNEFAAKDVDMVFFMSKREENFISSSACKELYFGGVDISPLVPAPVMEAFKRLKK
jgi:pantetheine-phosphate adenylyltransferase